MDYPHISYYLSPILEEKVWNEDRKYKLFDEYQDKLTEKMKGGARFAIDDRQAYKFNSYASASKDMEQYKLGKVNY